MTDDSILLRRFAEQRCERAFAEIVERHLGLVFHSALRQTGGDTLLAEEAAQAAFLLLARKASGLLGHPELAGWLHATACFRAKELVRTERRRHQREKVAHAMHDLNESSANDEAWVRLRPVIDEALLELPPDERAAVLLRYFEGRSFGEIGAVFNLGEDTVRKRVDRAIDRLQGALTKRGIVSPGMALAAVLAVPAVLAAPAGLAGRINGAALVAATVGGGTVAALSFLQLMTTAKIIALVSGVAAVIAVGTAVQQWKGREAARAEVSALLGQQGELRAKLKELESRLATEAGRVVLLEREQKEAASAKPATLATASAAEGPITSDMVNARFDKARELARNGQYAEALREYLWCYDIGMPQVPSYGGVRAAMLIELARMGESYPPALAAIRQRRDAIGTRLLKSVTDREALLDYGPLNKALGEEDKTLVVYDTLAADDKRRETLGFQIADQLLEERRYSEMVKVMPYKNMVSAFDLFSARRSATASGTASGDRYQRLASKTAAKHIEALAGAGDLANASAFIAKVLALDSSPESRALLAKHLARAGHPELLAP